MWYHLSELSLADTGRLFEYVQKGEYGADFNLKGFDYPWILSRREWRAGERILDVGSGYSDLPRHIASEFGCEVWALDDFGRSEASDFWLRGKSPDEFIASTPEVKYVLERLGDPASSSLPEGYFDCIYSASTLEHVPPHLASSVWKHMDRLLIRGGDMIHALDIALPTSRGLFHVLLASLFDNLYPLVPAKLRIRFAYETPRGYARIVQRSLDLDMSMKTRHLSIINMVLNPEIMVDPPRNTYHRITADRQEGIRHFRVASLLIHLRKGSSSGQE